MGLFGKIMGEFINVIEWTDNSNDTMVYRFERYGNEIKNGAKLIVRESQVAVFVKEGEIADVFEAGIYQLNTNNLPIMTTINHWNHAFNSPFKAEVYFFNMRQFTDMKWGTKNPLILRDKEFGAVRVRSFGTYSIQIDNPSIFLKEIVGTEGYFTVDEVSNQLRNLIISRFSTIVAQVNIPVIDLAANYENLGYFIEKKIVPDFSAYGLKIINLLIENISLPEKVEEALDKRVSMGLIGNLDDYLKYQSAEALGSLRNDSSIDFAVTQQMVANLNVPSTQVQTHETPLPPPIPKAQTYHVAIDEKPKGPLTMVQIKSLINMKKVTNETLIWREGMSGWEGISSLDELSALFEVIPPPVSS
jgi:membrane protease subunit (stomatin/prohibitin family)